MSHPPRVRGLKRTIAGVDTRPTDVAPPAGAWIETLCSCQGLQNNRVAPPAGAWIETVITAVLDDVASSRTPRGCVD